MSREDARPEMNFRHEYKYLIGAMQRITLDQRLLSLLAPDSHTGPDGSYLIRSIYFDDPGGSCARENEDGTSPREKWRVRAYNCSADHLSLECKRKERDMTWKSSCPITGKELAALCAPPGTGRDPAIDPARPLLNRFLIERQCRLLAPAVIVSYHRRPFVAPEGNVRVTLDLDIGSSRDIGRFFDPALPCRPILPTGRDLLEVKYDAFLPDYLEQALQLRHLQRIAFSKYCLCRRLPLY